MSGGIKHVTTHSHSGWDGTFESLPSDTVVSVRLGDLLKPTLEAEMKRVAELGHSVWIRYDRFREHHYFTLLLDTERLCDTDDPVGALMEIED